MGVTIRSVTHFVFTNYACWFCYTGQRWAKPQKYEACFSLSLSLSPPAPPVPILRKQQPSPPKIKAAAPVPTYIGSTWAAGAAAPCLLLVSKKYFKNVLRQLKFCIYLHRKPKNSSQKRFVCIGNNIFSGKVIIQENNINSLVMMLWGVAYFINNVLLCKYVGKHSWMLKETAKQTGAQAENFIAA